MNKEQGIANVDWPEVELHNFYIRVRTRNKELRMLNWPKVELHNFYIPCSLFNIHNHWS